MKDRGHVRPSGTRAGRIDPVTATESVTIYPDERDCPAAEVMASVVALVGHATNGNAARWGGVSGFDRNGCGGRI